MSSPRLTSPRGGGDRAPRLPAGFEYERVQLPSSRPSSRDPRQPRQSGIRGRRRPRPTSRSPLAPVFEDSSAWMDNYFYARPSVPRPSSATILRPPPSSPSSSSSPQTNNLHCTPWILNTETINTSHRCSDALFFRDSIDLQPGVTPTMYTPGAPYSELNWPLMEAQGFSQVRHPPRRPQQKQTDAVHEHHPTPKHPRRGSVVVQPRPRHELLLPDARVDPGVRDGGHAEVGSGSEAWNHRSGGGHEWEGGMDRTR
ncbi:uncharacterized protein PV06_03823 [Exophiala oligosperma]|uniref:Uncharacterized protein n=1 Tax=Exophiala oligosperma TaxID=215243 RepID=A0A0D2DSJ7_9EURO|nr:uncharacterized protein PV06_03823 [Exophiala oligosperma]KIW45430.1 hypothetical protein PV06_03823 [Exophiala oligosperma]